MRKETIFTVLILIHIIFPLCLAYNNERDGFRELRWGQSVEDASKLYDMIPLGNIKLGFSTYIRKDEYLYISNVRLQEIIYYFWKNKLFYVACFLPDNSQLSGLQEDMKRLYGDPTSERDWWYSDTKSVHTYEWEGQITTLQLNVFSEGRPRLDIRSTKITKEIEDQRQTPEGEGW